MQVSNKCIAVRKVATPLRESKAHATWDHTVLPMAAYRRVYDSRRLQADCQEPGSAR